MGPDSEVLTPMAFSPALVQNTPQSASDMEFQSPIKYEPKTTMSLKASVVPAITTSRRPERQIQKGNSYIPMSARQPAGYEQRVGEFIEDKLMNY